MCACTLYRAYISRDVVRNQGKWSGHEVAIKLLDRDAVPVNMQLRLEVKAMRDIRHKNLAAFVGACCDSPNVCILMELGPKGSLDDLLSSDSLNLDWNFKYALLKVSHPHQSTEPNCTYMYYTYMILNTHNSILCRISVEA